MGKYDYSGIDYKNKNLLETPADTTSGDTAAKPKKLYNYGSAKDYKNKNVVEGGTADSNYKSKYIVGVTGRPERTIMGTVGDIGVTAAKGGVNLLSAGYGLTNLLSFGAPKWFLNKVGIDPNSEEAHAFLNQYYSDAQQLAGANVDASVGAMGRLKALVQNPSVIAQRLGETAPLMAGGSAITQAARTAGVATPIAIGLGEGILQTGSAVEQNLAREGKLTLRGTGTAIGSGLSTGFFSAISGGVAKKLGIADVDDMFRKLGTSPKKVTRRLLEGGFTEGVLEEFPQSVTEQIWMNAAMGKEGAALLEGVPEAAVEGTLIGTIMGAGMAARSGSALEAQVQEEIDLIKKEAEQELEELEEIGEEDFLAEEEEGALPPEEQKPEKPPVPEKPEVTEPEQTEEEEATTPPEKKKKKKTSSKKKKSDKKDKKKKKKQMDEEAKKRLAELRAKRREDAKAAAAAGMSLADWYASQGLDAQGKLTIGAPPTIPGVTQPEGPTEADQAAPEDLSQVPETAAIDPEQAADAFTGGELPSQTEDIQDEDEDVVTPEMSSLQMELANSLGMGDLPTAPPELPTAPPQKPSDIDIPEGDAQDIVDKELADKFGGLTPEQQALIDKMEGEGKAPTKKEAAAAQKAIEMRESGELQRKRAEQFGIEPQGRHPDTGLFHWTYKGETFTTESLTKAEIRQKIGEIDEMRSKKAEAERQATILELYQQNQLGDVETDPFAVLDTIKGSDVERIPITYSALNRIYVETEDGTVFKGDGEVPGVSPSTASDEDLQKIIAAVRKLKQAAAEQGHDVNKMVNGYIVTDKRGTEHKVPAADVVTTKKGKGTEQRSLKDKAENRAEQRQYNLSEAAEIDEIIADARVTDKTNADIAKERGLPLAYVNQLTMDIREAQGTLADKARGVTDADKIVANMLLRTEKTKKPNRMIQGIAAKIKRMTDLGNNKALSIDDLISAGEEALWN